MLPQLRVFLVALEEGSLNRAATRLRMSQSALSRQMQALEAEIGGALLERTTSGIRPTDAGHALARLAPRILEDYDQAMAEARRLARGQSDLIRIGYLGSTAQTFLNPALNALRRSHPEVKVKLLDQSPGEQIAALRRGEIDLAVTGQEGALAANELYTRKLASFPVMAILPADHPLATRRKIALKQLQGERFLAAPEEDLPGRDRWITQLCRKAGFRPRFAQVGESISHGFSLISGEGLVSIGPAYLKTYPVAGVEMVALSDAITWDFLIMWQRGRLSPAMKAMLDTLEKTVHETCAKAKKP